MKLNTRLGEMDVDKEDDKFAIIVPPDSQIAQIFEKYEPKDWVALLEKCKDSGMKADEILTSTNKDGNQVTLSSENQDSLKTLIDFIAETAGIETKTPVKSKKAVETEQIDAEAAKEVAKRLGI